MAKKKIAKKKSARTTKASRRGSATPYSASDRRWVVERVQTGVRVEKRILKVLKGLAEYLDISLGDLLESIVLHAFEGKCAFSPKTRKTIEEFKRIYNLDLDATAGHRLVERDG